MDLINKQIKDRLLNMYCTQTYRKKSSKPIMGYMASLARKEGKKVK